MKKDFLPKMYKRVVSDVNQELSENIIDIKHRLQSFKTSMAEDMFRTFQKAIEEAIEDAYNEGVEDGRRLGSSD